jgi:hypothetical protein
MKDGRQKGDCDWERTKVEKVKDTRRGDFKRGARDLLI